MITLASPSVDVVVTRYKESLQWLTPYTKRPGWRVFCYLTRSYTLEDLPVCRRPSVTCTRVQNFGYEWQGYLTHITSHYSQLANITIFLQGNPLRASPDLGCLLQHTSKFAPLQALSFVQGSKRKGKLFQRCKASDVAGCRVWLEPMTTGFTPLLHADAYAHKKLLAHKLLKGWMYQFLMTQLGADNARAWANPKLYSRVLRDYPVPKQLYRAYGAQWAAHAALLHERPREWYARLKNWLTLTGFSGRGKEARATSNHSHSSAADILRGGFAGFWCRFSSKDKAIILEYSYFALLRGERFVRTDVCAACLPLARNASVADAAGTHDHDATCTAGFLDGAPRVERCEMSGDVRCDDICYADPQPGGTAHCSHGGELYASWCEVTRNDREPFTIAPNCETCSTTPPSRFMKRKFHWGR